MDYTSYKSYPIRLLNEEGKRYLSDNFSLYFNNSNVLVSNEEYYQLKVIRLLDLNFESIKLIPIKKHLNQIRLNYNFIFLMLYFKDQIIFCNIPIDYIESLPLSHQHNDECLQTNISINEIINNFQIDPTRLLKAS
jgi:hypothetical protein